MTYVASPSHSIGDAARTEDLKQCLETARKHLNETSRASDTERQQELVSSAIDAGWEEDEVRAALANEEVEPSHDGSLMPTLGVVPSSSL
ncbi:hypothetical protein [Rhizobium sp. S163]|uniref:hypothetical protein n=1 Tax=Rhizobium sp. S163 TaxID=3055039 RepID=UPI0025A95B1D|nr:hypothetical protein [Rhizobium sp. S163]MDM9644876.1 hypothetical protein [Rhizobium sp. S163]